MRLSINSDRHDPFLWKNPQKQTMKHRFARFSFAGIAVASLLVFASSAREPVGGRGIRNLAALVATPTAGGERAIGAGRLSANELLARAAERLDVADTVQASLKTETRMFSQVLRGSGSYAQLRSTRGLLVRLELDLSEGPQLASTKLICDGRDLWIHRRMASDESLERVDLGAVEKAAGEVHRSTESLNFSPLLATGGLPRLLRKLHENFDFSGFAPEAESLDNVDAWRLIGRWRPEKLAPLVPAQAEQWRRGETEDWTKLPSQLPRRVVLYVGQQDLFPYRIRFDRAEVEQEPLVHQAAALPDSGKSYALVEFYDVSLGGLLDPRQFDYQPGNISVADRTDRYLQEMGLAQRPAPEKRR